MKVKYFNLHLDFFEHLRSLTALEYILNFSRGFSFANTPFKLALFPRILGLRRFWESSTSRYQRRIWLPPLILKIRRWNYGHLLYWLDPIFPNTPAWNDPIACAVRNAERASQDSLVDWLIHLDGFAIQSMAWYNQSE